MHSRYLIISDIKDNYKNISNNLFDYIENYQVSGGKDEQAPLDDETDQDYEFGVDNHKSPFFLAGINCPYGGQSDGLYFCEERLMQSNHHKIFNLKDSSYTRHITDLEIIETLDQHGNIFFALIGEPKQYKVNSTLTDSITRHCELLYADDTGFHLASTKQKVTQKEIKIFFFGFKMGALPIYTLYFDTNLVSFVDVWSEFSFKNIAVNCARIFDSTYPLKQELFDTVIHSKDINKIGKYIISTRQDLFEFELFAINTPERVIKTFKEKHLENFNQYLKIETNLNYKITGKGLIQVDTSTLRPGQIGYIKASVDCGDFYNHFVFAQQQMSFEYIICKDD